MISLQKSLLFSALLTNTLTNYNNPLNEKNAAADAAHELKTPLAALNTHLQVYAISSDTEKKQHAFKQAQASLKESFHTIEQLLVLSKILPESIHQQLDPVDPKVFFTRIKNDYPYPLTELRNKPRI